MVRRSFLTIFFALLLVFGQQQAMVHAYAHTADFQQKSVFQTLSNQNVFSEDSSSENTPSENKTSSHSEVCGKCISLAGLGVALGSQAPVFDIASGHFQLSTSLTQSIISQSVLAYHSRAPPQIISI